MAGSVGGFAVGGFDSGDDPNIAIGVAVETNTALRLYRPVDDNTLRQIIRTVPGADYVVSFELVARTAGSVSMNFDGVEAIAAQTAPGVYAAIATASGITTYVDIVSASFEGSIDSVSVKEYYWQETAYVRDSLSLEGISNVDTPTRITLSYTAPNDSSPEWPEVTAQYTLPEATTGDAPLVESLVRLPAVFRAEEALLKSSARALRLRDRVRATWVSTDAGLALQRGTVAQITDASLGVNLVVLVDGAEMIDYGRYRITGLRYDSSHYPASIPDVVSPGTVPVGAIVMVSAAPSGVITIPVGWAQYTAANGKYIVVADAADSSYEVGDTGGSATFAGASGNTTTGGAHTGSASFRVISGDGLPGSGSKIYTPDTTPVGGHLHTYSTGAVTTDPLRRETVLMRKTGSTSATFPSNAMVFGLPGLIVQEIARSTAYAGRLIKAAEAANASLGVATSYASVTTGSTNNSHDHDSFINNGNDSLFVNNNRTVYSPVNGGGSHTHNITVGVSVAARKYRAALYAGISEFPVIPGMIVLWDGSLVSPPTDWVLCDGNNGSPDLRKYFIEIAALGLEGPGDTEINSIVISGTGTNDQSHSHAYSLGYSTRNTINIQHESSGGSHTHNHSISYSGDYTLPYYVLGAIMYAP